MKWRNDNEEEESKEIEEINKIIENNLKLETTINKSINESDNNLIKKYDWKILHDHPYHFKQNIEEILEIIKYLINNSQLNIINFKSSSNFWNVGSIFEGKILETYKFTAKIIKFKIFEELKKIEWIFYVENGEDFRLKINLHKVTEDNSTVLHLTTKYISLIGGNFIFNLKEKCFGSDFIKNIEKKLKKESIHATQYESGILLGTLEEIWDIITDNSKLVLIAPNNECFIPMNINKVKVGDISLIPMKIKNIEGYIEVKLDLKENKQDWNEWSFSYSILDGEPFKIIKQTVFVKLTKINKYETQISVYTKIYDEISLKMFKSLEQKKKYVISSLKDYFENFCSPENDIDN